MPLALNPNATFELTLDLDADLPESDRAVFIARHLTAGEVVRLDELLSKAQADDTDRTIENDLLNQALAIQLVGWRNVRGRDGRPVPFTVENDRLTVSDLILTSLEKCELIGKATTARRLDRRARARLAGSL